MTVILLGLPVTCSRRSSAWSALRSPRSPGAPDLPFIPVIQGWELSDYLDCVARYERAGIDLTVLPVVGLGSVCFPGSRPCCRGV